MKLSASQIACFLRCPREWAFKYLLGIPTIKTKAMAFGSAFHALLDGKIPNITDLLVFDREYPWDSALKVMYGGYLLEKKTLGDFAPVEREVNFENDHFHIIADEILANPSGHWYILENKTAALLDDNKRRMIPAETQMTAYVYHKDDIAERLWLDPTKFNGVLYVTTLKPLERRKQKETVDEFGKRLTSSTVTWAYPAEFFRDSVKHFDRLVEYVTESSYQISKMFEESKSPETLPCNTAQCVRWGDTCPHFESCHGSLKPKGENDGK